MLWLAYTTKFNRTDSKQTLISNRLVCDIGEFVLCFGMLMRLASPVFYTAVLTVARTITTDFYW